MTKDPIIPKTYYSKSTRNEFRIEICTRKTIKADNTAENRLEQW